MKYCLTSLLKRVTIRNVFLNSLLMTLLFSSHTFAQCDAGADAPILSSTTIANNLCVAAGADLTTITASNTPAGTISLEWHIISNVIDATSLFSSQINPAIDPTSVVSPGTYYAVFHDTSNNCYSPAASVTVTTTECAVTVPQVRYNFETTTEAADWRNNTQNGINGTDAAVGHSTSATDPNTGCSFSPTFPTSAPIPNGISGEYIRSVDPLPGDLYFYNNTSVTSLTTDYVGGKMSYYWVNGAFDGSSGPNGTTGFQEVILESSSGTRLTYTFDGTHVYNAGWQYIEIDLDAADWRLTGGVIPTTAQFSDVLTNLSEIVIESESGSNGQKGATCEALNEYLGIDRLIFEANPSTPVASPTVNTVSDANNTEASAVEHTVTLSAVTTSVVSYGAGLANVSASGSDYDTDLSNATLSNGVTYDAVGNEFVVPAGVSTFTVSIPTTGDSIDEPNETYTLSVGGVDGTGHNQVVM